MQQLKSTDPLFVITKMITDTLSHEGRVSISKQDAIKVGFRFGNLLQLQLLLGCERAETNEFWILGHNKSDVSRAIAERLNL